MQEGRVGDQERRCSCGGGFLPAAFQTEPVWTRKLRSRGRYTLNVRVYYYRVRSIREG